MAAASSIVASAWSADPCSTVQSDLSRGVVISASDGWYLRCRIADMDMDKRNNPRSTQFHNNPCGGYSRETGKVVVGDEQKKLLCSFLFQRRETVEKSRIKESNAKRLVRFRA